MTVPIVDLGCRAKPSHSTQAQLAACGKHLEERRKKQVRTVAHSVCDTRHLLHEEVHELVVDLLLHNEPRPRDTRLARGDEAREGRPVRGRLRVRVVEHDDGGLPAQLRGVRREVRACDSADRPPCLCTCLVMSASMTTLLACAEWGDEPLCPPS